MKTNNLVSGIPSINSILPHCEGCLFGKQSKTSYPTTAATRATVPLALVHTDLCGPMSTPSFGGALYFLLFIDDCSRFTSIYFLSKKSAILSHFQAYNVLVKNQFGDRKILILRSDNGGEFISNAFNRFCQDEGIQCQLTNPYNPAQNGISERKNRTLVEAVRSMLNVAHLINSFWAEAVASACYLQNCSYTSTLTNVTPYEL